MKQFVSYLLGVKISLVVFFRERPLFPRGPQRGHIAPWARWTPPPRERCPPGDIPRASAACPQAISPFASLELIFEDYLLGRGSEIHLVRAHQREI